ncbi:MAG: hypothetical protein AAF572_06920 [Cyanobacteria bacterium P01_B01_bin.77]
MNELEESKWSSQGVFITGEAGFIGFNFVCSWHQDTKTTVVLDVLICANDCATFEDLERQKKSLIAGNIM